MKGYIAEIGVEHEPSTILGYIDNIGDFLSSKGVLKTLSVFRGDKLKIKDLNRGLLYEIGLSHDYETKVEYEAEYGSEEDIHGICLELSITELLKNIAKGTNFKCKLEDEIYYDLKHLYKRRLYLCEDI